MDKNTFTGLLLIAAIVIGFSIYNAPSDEEIAEQRRINDSITQVQKEKDRIEMKKLDAEVQKENTEYSSPISDSAAMAKSDSLEAIKNASAYGVFGVAANKEEEKIQVETDLMKLTFSSKGGVLQKAVLKDYSTYSGDDLVLIDSTSKFNLNFFSRDNRTITTDELFFTSAENSFTLSGEDEKILSYKLDIGGDRYIEYVYTIKGNDYQLGFDVNMVGMDQAIDMRTGEIGLEWMVNAPSQEKSLKAQRDASTVFYKYKDEDVDDIGISNEEKEDFETSIKWVSLKQQFFNTTLIADEYFDNANSYAMTETDEGNVDYVKQLKTALTIPVSGAKIEKFGMTMYLGPNKYDILKDHGNDLQDIIDLGWSIFAWVNKIAVIPVFNMLDSTGLSYGIIILILTILLKVVLMPITYKTYLSGAKMRVLKPEINEINEKYKDDAMKKQQAMMTLYRQTGVNPLSGCIPMLIQMPILFAMFRFFPASIELRQESFLWADDLSTYDSIYDFPGGFEIPAYGDHISLFTILMAISIALYTKLNSQMSMAGATEGPMAAQMKIMTYLMPIMMLFFFNRYAAGLSYYYFLANIISIGQTFLIRKVFINEASIRAKIEQNKKKPKAKKKSGFQKRMEDMAKQKGIDLKK